jgi:hypothetical protein
MKTRCPNCEGNGFIDDPDFGDCLVCDGWMGVTITRYIWWMFMYRFYRGMK